MRFAFLLVFVLAGCVSLTQSERQGIIDAASQNAALAASQKAYDLVYAEALKNGKGVEEAKTSAALAAKVAGDAASAVAGKIADTATRNAEDEKGSKAGGVIAGIVGLVLNLAGAFLSQSKKAA